MAAPARATLDFFTAQAAARRRTAALLFWFAVALVATTAAIWAGLGAILRIGFPEAGHLAFSPELAVWVAGGVAAVTSVGGAIHRARLREGGAAVARMLGGVPVDRRTEDPGERRLVNVVEEMAIAAGLPVPTLYVLPGESGINAFAAGYAPDRAVVAVTRGALDRLSRDELQGVVAHELSHVLNGDMRLNLELLAVVGGLTALAAVGRFLVRVVGETSGRSRGSSSRSRRGGGGGGAAILAAGACVWLAGSIGAFFGRVLRAAVSRQRELLADAAAVQFTRNPDGLAGALARIARSGSVVESAFAPEAAHLFFANGLASSWLATHPPIEERIKRLVPQGYLRVMRVDGEPRGEDAAAGAAPAAAAPLAADRGAGAVPLTAAGLVASAGSPGPDQVARAAGVLLALPPELAAAARDPARAGALVRALLADADPATRAVQLGALPDPAVRAEVERLARALAAVARSDRMSVLDLALPALDALRGASAAALVAELGLLAAADGRTTVLEWAVLRIVGRRLAPRRRALSGAARPRTVEDVQVDLLDVLSLLAWAGTRDEGVAQAALDHALLALGAGGGWRILPRGRVSAARLEAALERLDEAVPALKARVLEACAAAVTFDGRILPAEGELVRAIAASLGVPVPPLAPDADPAAAARRGG